MNADKIKDVNENDHPLNEIKIFNHLIDKSGIY